MKFKFDPRAVAEITPLCFTGVLTEAALNALAQMVVSRAEPDGSSWLKVAGEIVPLVILERRDEQGQLYLLITVPEGVMQ